ncbi:MAG: PEP-CTERM sorting domain-containing protein [Acidobacteria bacterium]|nr:PEP-CTERM sorting domain-containing protein [Acidobacteriota bacterium]
MPKLVAAMLFLAGLNLNATVTYRLVPEDGTAETAAGLVSFGGTAHGYVLWMNHFVITAGGESIKQIQIAYGCPTCNFPDPIGLPFATGVPMYLWQGSSSNPAGATLVGQTAPVVIQPGQANNGTFITMDVLTECCFTPGTHIFVGTALSISPGITTDFRPAAQDIDFPHASGHSWFQFGTASTIPGVTTLTGSFFTSNDATFLIRAVGEECPEPATILLIGAGLGVAVLLRKRLHALDAEQI